MLKSAVCWRMSRAGCALAACLLGPFPTQSNCIRGWIRSRRMRQTSPSGTRYTRSSSSPESHALFMATDIPFSSKTQWKMYRSMLFTGMPLSSAFIHALTTSQSLIYAISRLAANYDLYPLYKKEFHELFEEFHEHPEFKPLLQRMNVVDANGESEMDDDQWEAASTSSPSHVRVLFC